MVAIRGKIGYSSVSRNGEARGADIWIINADSSSPVRLTDSILEEFGPVFSHDGKHILYQVGGNFTNNIWVMDNDGTIRSSLLFQVLIGGTAGAG